VSQSVLVVHLNYCLIRIVISISFIIVLLWIKLLLSHLLHLLLKYPGWFFNKLLLLLNEVRVLSHVEVLRLNLNVLLLYHVHFLLLQLMQHSHLLVKHKLFISVNYNHLLLPKGKVHLALNLTSNRSLY
jgi:hypothetical protein